MTIEYNPEDQALSMTYKEWVSWEDHVKPIYEEVRQSMDEDYEVTEDPGHEYKSIPVEDLTDTQINEIMENIQDNWERSTMEADRMDWALPTVYDCISPAVEEWCEEHFYN